MNLDTVIPSSFRDPSGFLFSTDNIIYRQVNSIYRENYNLLKNSGLYDDLVNSKLLIPHEEVGLELALSNLVYKIIKPESIRFISYPYEWCFSQLKDAALITLQIQKKAVDYGMSLKDGSAYNIQFLKGKPIFIDTLSFEKYQEGEPWVAYRQFCQHFLAPLALMSYKDIRLNQLFRIFIDGIPLDLASSLLPISTIFSVPLLIHIHLHAKSQRYFANKIVQKKHHKFSKLSLLGIIDSLENSIKKIKWKLKGTEWGEYYDITNYTSDALNQKKLIVAEFLEKEDPKCIWDLGANDGLFSRIASDKGIRTMSFDIDPVAVEKNYLKSKKDNETNILPLLLDLTNPSPSLGWENLERMSLTKRRQADTVFALALIHHLAISNNLPFEKIAHFFFNICNSLIIEFVSKSDSKVQKLLATREDIFPNYTQSEFEQEFSKYFTIECSKKLDGSERTIYLLRGRKN
jgi:hypothetical protein